MPTRKASATWDGGLQSGKGSFEGESGKISGSYSFGSRFGDAGGTNPEELLAAAEAACFSMALAGSLEQNGTPPTRVHTDAAATINKEGDAFRIQTIKLTCRAQVANLDADTFAAIAAATKAGCPVSKALAGVDISLDAQLEN